VFQVCVKFQWKWLPSSLSWCWCEDHIW